MEEREEEMTDKKQKSEKGYYGKMIIDRVNEVFDNHSQQTKPQHTAQAHNLYGEGTKSSRDSSIAKARDKTAEAEPDKATKLGDCNSGSSNLLPNEEEANEILQSLGPKNIPPKTENEIEKILKEVEEELIKENSLEKLGIFDYGDFSNSLNEIKKYGIFEIFVKKAISLSLELAKSLARKEFIETIEDFENDLIPMSRHPDAREEINRIRFKVKELLQKLNSNEDLK